MRNIPTLVQDNKIGCFYLKCPNHRHIVAILDWQCLQMKFGIRTILFFAAIACVGCSERPYNQYQTIKEAQENDALRKGWLPEWMPDNAINIHEVHDIDTNIHALSFEINSNNELSWPSECEEIGRADSPILKTRLFPEKVHELPNLKLCDNLFAVIDEFGVVHAWGDYGWRDE